MNKFASFVIAAAVSAISATAATSPLDATWYVGHPTVVVQQSGSVDTAERANPLAAGYYVGKPSTAFVGTAANVAPKGYVEKSSPLDATYYWSKK
jgi:hypothetical protein